MSEAWLNQWLDADPSTVLRRAVSDVAKKNGGGGATAGELMTYLVGRQDGPFTLLEVDGYYLIIRRQDQPQIRVHLGSPTLY